MAALLLALCGFALLDSLNVLNVGVASAVVYDSRLSRRSAVPGGLSFIAGVFAVTTTFGLCMVLGLAFLTDVVDFELTPTIRYRGELALGLVLIALACFPQGLGPASPAWASTMTRERPWLLGFVGIAIGLGQAPTAIPYLTALAMLSARDPLPPMWPLIVITYCAIALLPPLLVVALSTRRTTRAQRMQRNLVRVLNRYGPMSVRILFLAIGIALCSDALIHHSELWT
jgi:cytochrome c biogenesis protein CcdA